ncbi:beta family protein [Thiomicrospira pelophila]|uniref:beta family protein n=1 Tax=Thiomicrospira pelophila TaxID=934 RepID=UPI0004A73F38|nr:hypothetical protein [Thiomicrospira pelophila]
MYFPMLRWKKGEEIAMSKAPQDWSSRVSPIWMFEERKDYLSEYTGIKNVWSGKFIFDVSSDDIADVNVELTQVLMDPLASVAVSLNQLPLMTPSLIQSFSKKPVLKIGVENFDTAINSTFHSDQVNKIRQSTLRNITLILDFYEVKEQYIDSALEIAKFCKLYALDNVSSIILSSGFFPKLLDGILGRYEVKRKDREFYDEMVRLAPFPFLYSDYATIHPWWRQSDTMRSGHTNLKYAHDDYWLVLRDQGKGGDVSHALASLLVASPEYRSENFSWADKVWHDRSLTPPLTGPGNSSMHVSEFIHHHIAQVLAFR